MVLRLLRSHTYKTPQPALSSDFFEFKRLQDERAAALLSKHIWRLLKRARTRLAKTPGCDGGINGVVILLPPDFLNRLARDVVRMTEGETHGIKGCLLNIEYCAGSETVQVGQIRCDPVLSTTSILRLKIFRNETEPKPRNSLLRLLRGSNTEDIICISPGYLLEKRKVGKNS
ncbi:UNVERIFIED_CONTAM: hypothetical protein RMT77_003679 [Armadillidium vulgare]